MKKLLTTVLGCMLISPVFAYNATIKNDIGTTVTIQYQKDGLEESEIIPREETRSITLDPYTTYKFSYQQEERAPQNIMTIKKIANLIAQVNPKAPANGLLNIKIYLEPDTRLSPLKKMGYVDVLTSNGSPVYGGICAYNIGEVEVNCTLAQGINLDSLTVDLSLVK